jgi:phenylacetate-CoA ligase
MNVLRKIIFISSPYLLNEHAVFNELSELNRSQWLSRNEIERKQLKKLKELINYAYNNVPFYHFSMKNKGIKPYDIKTIDDLKKMPILTREDIRKNLKDLISVSYSRRNLYFSHTSGSTGEPLFFARSKKSRIYELASYYRFLNWYGWRIGDRIAKIWALPHASNKLFSKIKFKLSSIARNELIYNSLGMKPEEAVAFIKEIILKKPKIITGYTSALLYMSEIIQKYNLIPKHDFKWVVVNQAEMLTEHGKETIGKAFQANVYDFYGSREIPSIAASCPISPYLHINAEHRIVEIIKDDENVVDELGKIVITNLQEYAMPLIRYEIGDLGEKSIDICECGRGLPILTKVYGRTSDTLLINGKAFSFPSFRSIFEGLPVLRYQIIQKSNSQINVIIVLDVEFRKKSNELEHLVISRFKALLGTDVKINIFFQDQIKISDSAKHKYVIREI